MWLKSPAKSSTCFFSSPSWPARYTTPLLSQHLQPKERPSIVFLTNVILSSSMQNIRENKQYTNTSHHSHFKHHHCSILTCCHLELFLKKITSRPHLPAMPGGFSAKTFRKSAIFGPLCFCTSTATSTALPMNLAVDGLQDSGDIGFLTNSGWMLKQKSVSYTFNQQVWNKESTTKTTQYHA